MKKIIKMLMRLLSVLIFISFQFITFFDVSAQESERIKNSYQSELGLNGLLDFKCETDSQWTNMQVPGNYSIRCGGKWAKHYWDVFHYPERWLEKGAVYKKKV